MSFWEAILTVPGWLVTFVFSPLIVVMLLLVAIIVTLALTIRAIDYWWWPSPYRWLAIPGAIIVFWLIIATIVFISTNFQTLSWNRLGS